jgi:hypothetical protein
VGEVEKPRWTARELRMQKVKVYEEKKAQQRHEAKQQEQRQLIFKSLPADVPSNHRQQNQQCLADDATANSPVNSDNEDPTVNNDDDQLSHDDAEATAPTTTETEDPTTTTTPPEPPLSPVSILSANTKPTLIHPPRSITKQEDDEEGDAAKTSAPNCGLLCGCI